jgi:hypothetical protein
MAEPEAQADDDEEPQVEPPVQARQRGSAPEQVRSVAQAARDQLRDLHGSEAESLTALERFGNGWRATLEVVEVRRVPDSTDVLATYAVELDDEGRLVRYERTRRYYRAQADMGDDA